MPDADGYTGMPRWVKISGAIVLAIVLLFLGAKAFGVGPQHGPGMHGGAPNMHSPTSTSPATTTHETTDDTHEGSSPVAHGAQEIGITADAYSFTPREISVQGGRNVAIVLTSVDMLHDFTIDELDAHVAAEKGETNQGGFHAGRPGTYTFYCSEPGHREAGMEGTLVIEGYHHG